MEQIRYEHLQHSQQNFELVLSRRESWIAIIPVLTQSEHKFKRSLLDVFSSIPKILNPTHITSSTAHFTLIKNILSEQNISALF